MASVVILRGRHDRSDVSQSSREHWRFYVLDKMRIRGIVPAIYFRQRLFNRGVDPFRTSLIAGRTYRPAEVVINRLRLVTNI